jgi:branched-chain amino acid transport system substrate-binding protein
MMHKKVPQLILGAVLIAVLLVTAVACGGTSTTTTTSVPTTTTTTTTSTTTGPTTTGTTTIGPTTTQTGSKTAWTGIKYDPYTGKFDRTFTYYNVFPLSGTAATYGLNAKLGGDIAVSEINDMGGLVVDGIRYKVAAQYIDGQFNTTKTVEAAQLVVNQYNAKIVGGLGTSLVMATQDYYASKSVLHMAQTIGQPKNMGPKWPLQFMLGLDPADYGPTTYYPYLASNFKVKTLALVLPDSDNGRIFQDLILKGISNYNIPITLVAQEFYTNGTQDYSPLINRILALNPDAIDDTGATPADLSVFVKQVREKGYKGLIVNLCSQGDAAVAWQVAGDYSTGVMTIGFSGQDPTPKFKAFREYVEKQTGQAMFVSPPYSYEEQMMLFLAINKANSFDTYKIAAVFQDMTWDGLYGPTAFSGDQPGSPIGLKRIISTGQPLIKFTTGGKAEWVYRGTYPGK